MYPIVEGRTIRLAFRLCLFQPPFSFISERDMVRFRPWNGQYRVLKWCLLHNGKMSFGCKLLMFSVLHKPLIFREFASEGESARKYSLDFRGRTENSDGKNTGYWKSVSAHIAHLPSESGNDVRYRSRCLFVLTCFIHSVVPVSVCLWGVVSVFYRRLYGEAKWEQCAQDCGRTIYNNVVYGVVRTVTSVMLMAVCFCVDMGSLRSVRVYSLWCSGHNA